MKSSKEFYDRRCGRHLKLLGDRYELLANRRLGEHGLTSTQAQALLILFRSIDTQMTMKSLGDFLGVSQPTAAGIVARLAAKGLIETRADYSDRRSKVVEITASGRALCPLAADALKCAENELLEPLEPDERAAFQDILSRLLSDERSDTSRL